MTIVTAEWTDLEYEGGGLYLSVIQSEVTGQDVFCFPNYYQVTVFVWYTIQEEQRGRESGRIRKAESWLNTVNGGESLVFSHTVHL